jgi:heptosyltransferase-2
MATPFLAALRGRRPDAVIVLVCRDYVAEVFQRNQAIDSIVGYRGRNLRARIAAVRGAGAPGFDACFVLPPSFSSALVSRAAGARRRLGYGGEGRRLLLTDTLPGAGYRDGHLSSAYVRLLERYTGQPEPGVPLPEIVPPASWRETARELAGEDRYFIIAPGATYGSAKVWPHERYAALAKRIIDRADSIAVVIGTQEEREGAAALAERIGSRARNRAGALSLKGLIAVLRGATVTIGNDSGPVHVSAALGVPTVALFGPTSAAWTAPRGPAVRTVLGDIPCAPCFKRECPFGPPRCLARIEVDSVYEIVRDLVPGDSFCRPRCRRRRP